MPIHSETELYLPVKQFFERQGFEVRGEVKSCDLVAVRGEEEPVIVELKKTFNLPLLIQGIDRLKGSSRVYLAVEKNPSGKAPHGLKWSDLERLCRMLGLGLLTVRFYKSRKPFVELVCDPTPYAPRKSARRTESLLTEFRERSGDYNIGGSTRRKLVTAYREKALDIAAAMRIHGGSLTTKRLRELTGNPKVTVLLQNNYYQWFQRIERGMYGLTPLGEEALITYADVIGAKTP